MQFFKALSNEKKPVIKSNAEVRMIAIDLAKKMF